jgi:hypothetical protein
LVSRAARLSLLHLPFSDFNVVVLSIFAVIYGFDWVATVPPTVKLGAAVSVFCIIHGNIPAFITADPFRVAFDHKITGIFTGRSMPAPFRKFR